MLRAWKKLLGCASLAVAMAMIGGMAMSGESAQAIDRELQKTADELNRELDQATRQIHEAERLGQPSSVANRYGNAADIDRQFAATDVRANDELNRAAEQIRESEVGGVVTSKWGTSTGAPQK